MSKQITIIIIFFFIKTAFAQEADYGRYGIDVNGHLPAGLETGTLAADFEVKDTSGKLIRLSELWKEQTVILIFYRGAWCPVCIRYLGNLQDSLPLLQERGAMVVAVTPEVAESVEKTKNKTEASFLIISDHHESIMRAYDVWFDVTGYYQTKVRVGRLTTVASNNGTEEARLPVPATFIINKEGKIVYRHFDLNYKQRASVREMLNHLP